MKDWQVVAAVILGCILVVVLLPVIIYYADLWFSYWLHPFVSHDL